MSIFNLDDVSDIDEETKSQLKVKGKLTDKIIELFKLKNTLSLDEVMVALSRKFSLKKKRAYITNSLCILAKKGFIKRIPGRQGVYEIYNQKNKVK